MAKAAPSGGYVIVKGSPTDPCTTYVTQGQREVIDPMIEAGDVAVVDEQFTDGWLPADARRNTEQLLAANDGTAGGVVSALRGAGLDGAVPVSGQDGDVAAPNRIAQSSASSRTTRPSSASSAP